MSRLDVTVAVTGLNAIDSPGPGIGVIRAIRDDKNLRARIIGLSYESLEPGVYMHDIVDKSYQIPYPKAGRDQLRNRLQNIHSKEKLDVIIPNFDAELHHFIRLTPTLQNWGIHTYLPTLEQLAMVDKMHLHQFGAKHGFLVPKTEFLTDKTDIKTLKHDFDFPMVIKGNLYEAYVAYNEGQIASYYDRLNAKWGLPVIIQEFIKGTEIDIAGLGDGQGNLIGAIPMRKLYITDKGKGWSGVVLGDQHLIEMTEKFITDSKWKGGFELELMSTEKGKIYIMEINPRFPAWVYTTAAAGQNLPAALVKLAIGLHVAPYENYQVRKMFIRYSWDLITDISEFEQITTSGEL